MSLNIPDAVMKHTTKGAALLDVDLNKLSKIQKSKLCKMLKNGVIVGSAMPAVIAESKRIQLQLPIAKWTYGKNLYWKNIPDSSPFFNALKAATVASVIATPDIHDHYKSDRELIIKYAENKKPTGRAYSLHYPASKIINKLSLGSNSLIDELINRIESESTKVVQISYPAYYEY
jgi:hypothetical protein